MPTTTGAIAELLAPDLRRVYVETGKERPLEYPIFFNVEDMEWNPLTDQQVSGLGTLPGKDEGEQFTMDDILMGGTKTYTAVPFGMAVEITWEAWRDELYGIMREMVRELARASRNRQEVDAWAVLNNAFVGTTIYDGFTSAEALVATSHTGLDGNTRANRPSTDISFSQTGLQNAITRFENMTDDRDLPRLMTPSMILIAPENKFVAREVLGSPQKAYTAQNEINALIEEDLTWMVVHYFTTSTYWFLCASKGQHDVNFLWRDHPIFDMFDDPWTKNAIATVYQRHTKGHATWRGIDGTTG
jgi:hypothetical protein